MIQSGDEVESHTKPSGTQTPALTLAYLLTNSIITRQSLRSFEPNHNDHFSNPKHEQARHRQSSIFASHNTTTWLQMLIKSPNPPPTHNVRVKTTIRNPSQHHPLHARPASTSKTPCTDASQIPKHHTFQCAPWSVRKWPFLELFRWRFVLRKRGTEFALCWISLSELAGWSGQLDRAMCESFAIGVTVSTLVPAWLWRNASTWWEVPRVSRRGWRWRVSIRHSSSVVKFILEDGFCVGGLSMTHKQCFI